MAQRDYLLRMIERMGQVLIRLRKMLAGERFGGPRFREEFDAAASQFGITPAVLRDATPETLVMLFGPTVDPSRCWLAAELLYLEGLEAETDARNDDAVAAFAKATLLFRLIEPAGVMLAGWPEAAERIEDIRQRLDTLGPADSPPA
ncbi:MAG: hypothetical protein PVH00_04985 [Gemmatimonadota bacterium]